MLVLTRREGEAVVIDGDVRVVVLSHDHRGVRLGIEAPIERTVLREELLRQVVEENQRAAAVENVEWTSDLAPAAARLAAGNGNEVLPD
jgi:carbon storage regulator